MRTKRNTQIQNEELLTAEAGGMYSYRWALKFYAVDRLSSYSSAFMNRAFWPVLFRNKRLEL
jgi:hypothetical protein